VLFDRSWYNRAGVERVMGFCSDAEYDEFMRQAPEFERHLVRSGVHLFKFWFSVSRAEQRRRFKERKAHPLKQWKLSPIDMASPGQVGRLHARQGSDVPAHRHLGLALDGDQERLQEARAAERHALPAAPLPYTNKDTATIGTVDPLLVGRAALVAGVARSSRPPHA
jgi:polyphosphate kinase